MCLSTGQLQLLTTQKLALQQSCNSVCVMVSADHTHLQSVSASICAVSSESAGSALHMSSLSMASIRRDQA